MEEQVRRGEDRALGGGPGLESLEPKTGADPLDHPRSLGWGSGLHEPEARSVVKWCGARSCVLPMTVGTGLPGNCFNCLIDPLFRCLSMTVVSEGLPDHVPHPAWLAGH